MTAYMSLTTFRAAAAALCLTVLAGCATVGAGADPQTAVRARANQRWQHMMAGKFDEAYAMLAPGYRAVRTAQAFKDGLNTSVKWESAQVLAVDCESAESCAAKIRLEVVPPANLRAKGNIVTHFDEKWILVDGQWWHFPNR
jgi:hypothetical protein